MSVLESEEAISQLPAEELSRFASWFEEFMADEWEKQIERNVAPGRSDKINAKVDKAIAAGHSSPL
jgi:hypothetical protein